MNTKNEIKDMLERNLGVIENTPRLEIGELSKILNKNIKHVNRDLIEEFTKLYRDHNIPLIDLVSCKEKSNPTFLRMVRNISNTDSRNIAVTNFEALAFIADDKIYLSETLTGMLCARYSSIYRYLIIITFREVVENLKKAGLRIQGLEDITAANIYKDVTKQYLDSVKEIFIEKYKDRMTKGGSVSERENYWRDYKYNLLENIATTNEMLNHLFNDDFEEEINELHDEV